MLQFVEGDTAWENPGIFYQVLRAYGDSFKYGTASTADFQRINEQFSGLDLDWFFNEWVYDRGYPRYTITWTKQPLGDSWQVSATLAQHNDTNSARLFHMPFPVRFNCAGESTLVTFYPRDTVALDTFVLAAEPLSLTPDPDNWVLDRTEAWHKRHLAPRTRSLLRASGVWRRASSVRRHQGRDPEIGRQDDQNNVFAHAAVGACRGSNR
jgi:hypothetical protein